MEKKGYVNFLKICIFGVRNILEYDYNTHISNLSHPYTQVFGKKKLSQISGGGGGVNGN